MSYSNLNRKGGDPVPGKIDYSKISNIEKEQIILKGFVTRSDIKKLIGYSTHKKASDIFDKANEINISLGAYCDANYVNVDYVLKVLGKKANDFFRNADIERKLMSESEQQKRDTCTDQS